MILNVSLDPPDALAADGACGASGLPSDFSQPPLSEAQTALILQAKESARLEFKRVSGKMVSKALETVCAFANSNGGTLVLGLADPSLGPVVNRIHGIEENPEAVDELRRKIRTQLDPAEVRVRYRYVPVVSRHPVGSGCWCWTSTVVNTCIRLLAMARGLASVPAIAR